MKGVSYEKVFSNTKADNVRYLHDETFRRYDLFFGEENGDIIRKVICENFFIQQSLLDELVFINNFKQEFDSIGLNSQFFAGELYNAEKLFSVLKAIYGVIIPMADENSRIIGYHTSTTSPLALTLAEELYDKGGADNFITRFLSLTEARELTHDRRAVFLEAEKITASQGRDADIRGENFYKIISDYLKHAGIYTLMVNRLNEEELERDFYIQKLLELGHKVYIGKFEEEKFLRVIIR